MGHGRLVKFNMVKENKDKFYKDIQTAYKKIDNSFSSFVPCHEDRFLPYDVHNRADVYKDTSWGTEKTSCRDIYDPNKDTTIEVHRDYVRRLDLSNNLLVEIPEGILDSLEISSLILRDNQISEIQAFI